MDHPLDELLEAAARFGDELRVSGTLEYDGVTDTLTGRAGGRAVRYSGVENWTRVTADGQELSTYDPLRIAVLRAATEAYLGYKGPRARRPDPVGYPGTED